MFAGQTDADLIRHIRVRGGGRSQGPGLMRCAAWDPPGKGRSIARPLPGKCKEGAIPPLQRMQRWDSGPQFEENLEAPPAFRLRETSGQGKLTRDAGERDRILSPHP